MLDRTPLTRGGATLAAFAALAYLAGWRFGWIELMILTAACLLALIVAVPFVVGRLRLDVSRTLAPEKVEVGEPASAELRISNPSKRPVGWRLVEDRISVAGAVAEAFGVEISGLAAGATHEVEQALPTGRRGLVEVGPALIAKSDPLGLMRREVRQTEPDTLWVRPKVVAVNPVPVGLAKDLEGPTSDTSPAGDVAFHTLREYQVGDDHRHVHWLSSARAGSLMVRHYVDNRRPHLTVLIDDRSAGYDDETLEVAVDIAATLTVNAQRHQQPVALRLGTTPLLGQTLGGSPDDVLDRLTLAQSTGTASLLEQCTQALESERGTSALAIVTGALSPDELMPVVSHAARHAGVFVVRAWPAGHVESGALPGASVFDVDGLERFQIAWNRVMQ